MNTFKFLAIALLASSTMHAYGAESRLELHFVVSEADANGKDAPTLTPVANKCRVAVQTPNDLRKNKDTLGTTFRDNPITSAESPVLWLQEALLNLNQAGLETRLAQAGGNASSGNAVGIRLDLEKLYIWNHGMNLHATIVAHAKIQSEGGEVLKKYRLNSTKLNWANADSEFVTTLNIAATRLLEQIASDISNVCGKPETLQVKAD